MELIANPVWKWGVYYEQILRRFLNKTMQEEYQESNKALNYYWGMSAGVVDVVYAPKMERASKRFADFLRDGIIQNVCTPFLTPLTKQNGEIIGAGQKSLALDQIISMDYLVENVIGTIPQYGDLNEMGKATVDTAGVEPAQEAADDTREAAQGGEAQETEAVES